MVTSQTIIQTKIHTNFYFNGTQRETHRHSNKTQQEIITYIQVGVRATVEEDQKGEKSVLLEFLIELDEGQEDLVENDTD